MDIDFNFETETAPIQVGNSNSLYKVVAYHPQGVKREEFFQSRTKAVRLMEVLADQGVAVTMRQYLAR